MLSTTSLFIATSVLAAAADAPIERVVVFADRAQVTRASKVHCTGSEQQVAFNNLPVSLDVRTLRPHGDSGVDIVGSSHRREKRLQQRDAKTAKLDAEIESLRSKLAELAIAGSADEERVASLQGYEVYMQKVVNEQVRNGRVDTKGWQSNLDRFRSEREGVSQRQAARQIEARQLQRARDILQRERQSLNPDNQPEAINGEVACRCKAGTTRSVRLSYVVPGATWKPEYDVRFAGPDVGAGKVTLTVAAVVQQSTGEDWQQAELLLSTAKPRLGSEAPEPLPMVVRGRKAEESKTVVQAQEKRRALAIPNAQPEAPSAAPFEDRGQSFAMQVQGRVTVKADGRPYWMPVQTLDAKAKASRIATPKLSPYVYRMVEFKNPAAYALLGGRLHSYRGNSFVGDSRLGYKAPGEAIEASLGVDDSVRVLRSAVADTDEKAGLIGSTKTLNRHYRIELRNNSGSKTSVLLRENIPVSKSEKIKASIDAAKTTKGYLFDAEQGFVSWLVNLSARDQDVLYLRFSIDLPDDWNVHGQ